MSEIEWSPWIKGDPEPFARFSDIQVYGQSYRIPMEDYKRIYGDPLDTHPDSDLDADQYSVGSDTLQYDPEDVAFTATASSAPDFLRAALSHMEDRKATYDAPQGERSMGKTVAAFNAITGLDLSEEKGWLFMVLLKSVRTQQGGFRADNYEDGAAYFGLQGEAAAKERGSE